MKVTNGAGIPKAPLALWKKIIIISFIVAVVGGGILAIVFTIPPKAPEAEIAEITATHVIFRWKKQFNAYGYVLLYTYEDYDGGHEYYVQAEHGKLEVAIERKKGSLSYRMLSFSNRADASGNLIQSDFSAPKTATVDPIVLDLPRGFSLVAVNDGVTLRIAEPTKYVSASGEIAEVRYYKVRWQAPGSESFTAWEQLTLSELTTRPFSWDDGKAIIEVVPLNYTVVNFFGEIFIRHEPKILWEAYSMPEPVPVELTLVNATIN